jgi:predicted site-specific integrase-resolvase
MKTLSSSTVGTTSDSAFFTTAALCKRWGVSSMYIHRMRQANRLKCIKLGPGAVRFQPEEIARIEQEAAA